MAPQEPFLPDRPPGGLVIAVHGARADLGVTAIATALVRAFRSLGSEQVGHAELDPRVARSRGEASNAAEADRMVIPGSNAALVRDPDGVWTLAMTRPRAPTVGDAKGVMVALDTMRDQFPVSVAELEHQVNERTLAAFDAADRIVIVTEGVVPSLRATQRVLRLCRRLNYPDEKMCVVVTRYDAADSLPVADIAAALKREVFWKIGSNGVSDLSGLAEKLLAD